MTTNQIIHKITSKEPHQIWSAACEIISLSQNKEAIRHLIPFVDEIVKQTKGIKLGGAFAPNKRFLDGAIKTLAFHRDSDACPCHLYGIHECMDPNKEVEKGYLSIHHTNRIDNKWVDYYEASCTRCEQKFNIEEREGHYMWWGWKRTG